MTQTTRTLTKLISVFALTLILVGIGTQAADATQVPAGPAGSRSWEKSWCTNHGGAWTVEHAGSVGICTYPGGGQTRCNFRKGTCTMSMDFSVPASPKAGVNPVRVDGGHLSESASTQATPQPDRTATAAERSRP